jgi:hypothetical protein
MVLGAQANSQPLNVELWQCHIQLQHLSCKGPAAVLACMLYGAVLVTSPRCCSAAVTYPLSLCAVLVVFNALAAVQICTLDAQQQLLGVMRVMMKRSHL